ncbi:glycosyltransferase [Streptomyces albireticuli]|uniref:Glycosyl transferase n=1 Tax=Streptomyces albireticuli TaxID=1940 RepID=A0A2A2DEW0_9ACTN|nr:glycosyltransferase [Streptomyces albireticuli]MCD9194770.1 glycosyltransferase [Streptomyces albireticuli]PAU49996.1 glycosyl transferase [Streptomyces albireticuli]
MRFLLSTIGSRGEVQPLVALALRLKEAGHGAVVCAPPDFREWAESLGVVYVPVGPELRGTAKPSAGAVPTAEQRRRMIEGTVAAQFEAVDAAAEGCAAVVAGGGLAIAARSVAERRGIGYVYAAFAPVSLPSEHHAPPVFRMLGETPAEGPVDNRALWAEDAERWNSLWGPALNARRAAMGLPPVEDVRAHLFTGTPWLAADPTLAPWPTPSDLEVVQTGAWLLADDRPLSRELEAFLDAGEPPLYFGFGSGRVPEGLTRTVIDTARALGRRVVLSRGWADLSLVDDASDCLLIGEVNQQALFPRVAAVVHHGGAGTTTAATMSGTPQVVVPQHFDQFHFAERVERLGIGARLSGEPTAGSLTNALREALGTDVIDAARAVGGRVRTDGAAVAARRLVGTW